jgi:hypothetical protein
LHGSSLVLTIPSWQLNQILIGAACDNTEAETNDIKLAIQKVAASSSVDVDERFILAIIMQESKGCVRVQSTNNGVQNTGLMQSHDGAGSCNKNGVMTTPCPQDEITLMIQDGTAGTSAGDGLQQCFAAQSGETAARYYKAARTYNSGSIASSGNLGQGIATHCYASDIANRLSGWAGDVTECVESTIGSVTSGLESVLLGENSGDVSTSSSSSSSAAAQPTETAEPETSAAPAETVQPSSTAQPAEPSAAPTESISVAAVPTQTPQVNVVTQSYTPTPAWTTKSIPASTVAASSSSSSAPIYPQANSSCQQYYTVSTGDFCKKVTESVGISFSDLRSLNTGLDKTCSNLWLGYQYCVKA